MRRKGPTRGNNSLIPTCLLAALLAGSLSVPRVSAQSAESYRQHAVELSRAKSWDEAIANYRKALVLEVEPRERADARAGDAEREAEVLFAGQHEDVAEQAADRGRIDIGPIRGPRSAALLVPIREERAARRMFHD